MLSLARDLIYVELKRILFGYGVDSESYIRGKTFLIDFLILINRSILLNKHILPKYLKRSYIPHKSATDVRISATNNNSRVQQKGCRDT